MYHFELITLRDKGKEFIKPDITWKWSICKCKSRRLKTSGVTLSIKYFFQKRRVGRLNKRVSWISSQNWSMLYTLFWNILRSRHIW
jgi:hypothetical protein